MKTKIIMYREMIKAAIVSIVGLTLITQGANDLLGNKILICSIVLLLLGSYQCIKLLYITMPILRPAWLTKIMPKDIKDAFKY